MQLQCLIQFGTLGASRIVKRLYFMASTSYRQDDESMETMEPLTTINIPCFPCAHNRLLKENRIIQVLPDHVFDVNFIMALLNWDQTLLASCRASRRIGPLAVNWTIHPRLLSVHNIVVNGVR